MRKYYAMPKLNEAFKVVQPLPLYPAAKLSARQADQSKDMSRQTRPASISMVQAFVENSFGVQLAEAQTRAS